nr:MAG TPA: hypothetical protein [Caudoviricetes sp.]DAU58238.1 MAG TPA: hypothetical protein [Caudoviricetes sp.]DAX31536.1 MAG TPA: hypothetical protein [Caudoviricetes sp.]
MGKYKFHCILSIKTFSLNKILNIILVFTCSLMLIVELYF